MPTEAHDQDMYVEYLYSEDEKKVADLSVKSFAAMLQSTNAVFVDRLGPSRDCRPPSGVAR